MAERYGRLVELQDELSWEANRALVGREVEVLLAEGEGRKDAGTGRMSGRARDGRLVHLRADSEQPPRPGDFASHRHHPRRAAPPARRRTAVDVRRTAAGDAWAAGRRPVTPRATAPGAETVGLGLPRVRFQRAGVSGEGSAAAHPAAVAFCPHPPLLVPEVGAGEPVAVRAPAIAAVRWLASQPIERIVAARSGRRGRRLSGPERRAVSPATASTCRAAARR